MEIFHRVMDPGFTKEKAREIIREEGFVRFFQDVEGIETYLYPPVPSMMFCVGTALLLCVCWELEGMYNREELAFQIEQVIKSIRRFGIY